MSEGVPNIARNVPDVRDVPTIDGGALARDAASTSWAARLGGPRKQLCDPLRDVVDRRLIVMAMVLVHLFPDHHELGVVLQPARDTMQVPDLKVFLVLLAELAEISIRLGQLSHDLLEGSVLLPRVGDAVDDVDRLRLDGRLIGRPLEMIEEFEPRSSSVPGVLARPDPGFPISAGEGCCQEDVPLLVIGVVVDPAPGQLVHELFSNSFLASCSGSHPAGLGSLKMYLMEQYHAP